MGRARSRFLGSCCPEGAWVGGGEQRQMDTFTFTGAGSSGFQVAGVLRGKVRPLKGLFGGDE